MTLRDNLIYAVALTSSLCATSAWAAVSADEAQQLKKNLTPFGAEKAANSDGTIPAWTGGLTSDPAYQEGGRRDHLFSGEKPLFSITSANLTQYADKLTDGVKAMFAKYPDSYRIDVYKTERTSAAPQWVYDNTFKNATSAKLVDSSPGPIPEGAFGGIPFPVPKNGTEVMWNHLLSWRGSAWGFEGNEYLITADGQKVLLSNVTGQSSSPYNTKGAESTYDNVFWQVYVYTNSPAIRAGEGITGRLRFNDDKSESWVYLTGQRRVRKLPNACCDTPVPTFAGVMSFDEIEVFAGRMGRFDWSLVGKKEMYVPANDNQAYRFKDDEIVGPHHLNPDAVRWELRRVWIVEAVLKAGQRHVSPKGRYYIDEDHWHAVLGERWDGSGQMWKLMWGLPMIAAEVPTTYVNTFGFNDLISGAWASGTFLGGQKTQMPMYTSLDPNIFTPDYLAAGGIR